MNTLTWRCESYSEAADTYRSLLAQGHKARMWLSYASSGWVVSIPR